MSKTDLRWKPSMVPAGDALDMTVRKRILSIDGGGIRGIIPATVLMKLEEVTKKPARETFSLVAGTSTGAVIAAAVAAGIPAVTIRDLYLSRTRDIFVKGPWSLLKWVARGHRYEAKTLHAVLADEFSRAPVPAQDWSLNDSPIDLLITAKRVPDGEHWYFVRDDNQFPNRSTGKLKLIDCVTGSAAAPTFFEPYTIAERVRTPNGNEAVGTLVDGGVGVTGNPVYQACVEAFFFTNRYSVGDTLTVSLGTGRYVQKQLPTWLLPWFKWSLAQLLDSPGEQQTELVNRHFPAMPFYRIDLELLENIGLDDTGSIDLLTRYGDTLASRIDWNAILDGTDKQFRIDSQRTRFEQYKAN